MDVRPTPDQEALIRDAIASGRLHRPEEAMHGALSLWEERERKRLNILVAVGLSKAAMARGEGRTVTSQEESDRLARDVIQRGTKLLSQQNARE